MTQPTPEEVRTAADIVQALSVSIDMPHPDVHWRPSELRAEAERIEEAAREEAAREVDAGDLAVAMYQLFVGNRWADAPATVQESYANRARALVNDGWHKGECA